MELPFDGSLTKKDFISALKLAGRSMAKKSLLRMDPWIPFLGLGILLFVGGVYAVLFRPERNFNLFTLSVLGVLLIGFAIRSMPSQIWNSKPATHIRITGYVTEEGLVFFHPNGQLTIKWEGYKGYGKYREVVNLFNEQGAATPFAKAYFKTEQDWMTFKEMVKRRLPLTHDVNYRKIKLAGWHYALIIILLINLILMVLLFNGIINR